MHISDKLVAQYQQKLHIHKQKFMTYTAKLDAMSPLKVMTRGYSLVHNRDGKLVSSVQDVEDGMQIAVSVSDGSFDAIVKQAKE